MSCPFFNPNTNSQSNSEPKKCPFSSQKQQSDEEPRGSCPFRTTQTKKNPPLEHVPEAFNTPFLQNHDDMDVPQEFPFYLRSSLFMQSDEIQKVRKLPPANRLFIAEDLKEQANDNFTKKNFYEASLTYQSAISLFNWLEYYEKEEDHNQVKTFLDSLPYSPKADWNTIKDIKPSRFLIMSYEEGKLLRRSFEECTDSMDLSNSKSIVVILHCCLSASLMHQSHFQQAREVLEDALQMTKKSSLVYFRLAQALTFDKYAQLKEFQKAKSYILQAMEVKKSEKIFVEGGPGVLKQLNLHNAKEAYQELLGTIMEKIASIENEQEKKKNQIIQKILKINASEKLKIEKNILGPSGYDDTREYFINKAACEEKIQIIQIMKHYYEKVNHFYVQSLEYSKITPINKELQNLLQLEQEMKNYPEAGQLINFSDIFPQEKEEVNQKMKFQLRRDNLCLLSALELFDTAEFNFSIYKQALEHFFHNKKVETQQEKQQNISKPEFFGKYMHMLFFALILACVWALK